MNNAFNFQSQTRERNFSQFSQLPWRATGDYPTIIKDLHQNLGKTNFLPVVRPYPTENLPSSAAIKYRSPGNTPANKNIYHNRVDMIFVPNH